MVCVLDVLQRKRESVGQKIVCIYLYMYMAYEIGDSSYMSQYSFGPFVQLK